MPANSINQAEILRALKQYKSVQLPAVEKTAQMLDIEKTFSGYDIRLVFKVIYELTGLQVEIAKLCSVQQATISRWCDVLGIELTTRPYVRINAIKTEEIDLPVAE